VSEGTSQAKLRTIRQSTYLSFCLDRLRLAPGNAVVFGHSLSSQDQHVVDALNSGSTGSTIGVALLPDPDAKRLALTKAEIVKKLDLHEVEFFDATTHPLGSSDLQVQDE
jgi:hypothetical protein